MIINIVLLLILLIIGFQIYLLHSYLKTVNLLFKQIQEINFPKELKND